MKILKYGVHVMLIVMLSLSGSAQSTESIYKLGPDSQPQPGVPTGTLTKYRWESKIYQGTFRDYYVYVPAQYNASVPAALMIFQDGYAYARNDGDFRVPVVFDNLMHQKAMPVTIGLF